jgi:hypothetical protein
LKLAARALGASVDFITRIESAERQPTEQLQQWADVIREYLDKAPKNRSPNPEPPSRIRKIALHRPAGWRSYNRNQCSSGLGTSCL